MESHDYSLRGFNISEVGRGFLDVLAFMFVVLAIGDFLSLPVSVGAARDIVIVLGGGYSSLRVMEFSDRLLEEVSGFGSSE